MTQEEALAILKTGLNVFLTGEPGSGKTHTVRRYVAWLRERGVEPSVTASTGIAATHLGGQTLHAWSGIGVKRSLSDHDIELIASREKAARRILEAKVLIVDEISMLDAQTLESADRVLRTIRRKPLQPEEPFGGLQVVFVGDFFQLPPVSREDKSRFAFESAAWKETNPVVCYLSEQHRQEDAAFLDLLSAMRRGSVGPSHRALLSSRIRAAEGATLATRLYTHNDRADRINAESLARLPGAARVFRMESRGPKALVESLKAQCLSPEALGLKEGAAVMFTRNNFDEGYVNGTLGTVEEFTKLGEPVVRTRDGARITVAPAEWAIQDGGRILARISQLPLRLAWAITVHKSQGMSLDAASMDLSAAFEFGQGYVALSRVRSLSGLFLEGFGERALEVHPEVARADRYFRGYSDAARRKFASLPAEQKEKMEKSFLRAIGAKEPVRILPEAAADFVLRNSRLGRSDSPRSKSAAASGGRAALLEKYPNAGKPWGEEDDALLRHLFAAKEKDAAIARRFGRKPSAIRARLAHLGLVPNVWKKH